MISPPLPRDEQDRLAALHTLKILDTPAEERFDRITRLAEHVLNVPIVLISLVDFDRQWFKSRQGLDVAETSRDVSFCGHAILENKLMVVPDALRDERFEDNPLVTGEPYIRFYAAHPVAAPDGSRVGTLCAIDRDARTLTEKEQVSLRDLALLAENELNVVFLAEREQTRAQTLEAEVKARTAELAGLNARLTGEIKERTQTKRMLSTILETVGEGIFLVDRLGEIVMANPQAHTIWQCDHQTLIGRNISTLVSVEDLPATMSEYIAEHTTASQGSWLNVVGLRENGSTVPLEICFTESEIEGQLRYTAAVRDVTRQHELDRLRDDFVATISHELRTPLTATMGFIETLLSGKPGPLTSKQERFLRNSYKSSERLRKLIEKLLTISKIEQGNLEIHRQYFLPARSVENILEIVAPLFKGKGVELEVYNDWPPDCLFLGDQDQLEQVLINFASNALKFTPEGGRVRINARESDGQWRIEVADTGIGIPAADQSRLFERFSRASNAQTEEIQGAGLGLYVCQGIVQAHDGQIGLESKEGVGTRVWFTIPIVA